MADDAEPCRTRQAAQDVGDLTVFVSDQRLTRCRSPATLILSSTAFRTIADRTRQPRTIAMTNNKTQEPKTTQEPRPDSEDEQDVEGHNMWIASTVASDLARDRTKDLEREAKEHRRAKEANKKS